MQNKKAVAVQPKKAIIPAMTAEQEELLSGGYPEEEERSQNIYLPRLQMLAKDKTEEKIVNRKKEITVLEVAGTFYTETEDGEVEVEDEKGKIVKKKNYVKNYFSDQESIDLVVFFQRYQLKYYDNDTESWITSTVYDFKDEEVTLWHGKKKLETGKPADLQDKYPRTDKGQPKLEAAKILYVLFNGEAFQISLSTSSKIEFLKYRASLSDNLPKFVTNISSEERVKGDNVYRVMKFAENGRTNAEQAELIIPAFQEVCAIVAAKKEKLESQVAKEASETDDQKAMRKEAKDY